MEFKIFFENKKEIEIKFKHSTNHSVGSIIKFIYSTDPSKIIEIEISQFTTTFKINVVYWNKIINFKLLNELKNFVFHIGKNEVVSIDNTEIYYSKCLNVFLTGFRETDAGNILSDYSYRADFIDFTDIIYIILITKLKLN